MSGDAAFFGVLACIIMVGAPAMLGLWSARLYHHRLP